uniref:Putative secreted protein n=1 Tax=Anopheles darlingi TaxID=43151 RepID=A0A2M4DJB9_ANODA
MFFIAVCFVILGARMHWFYLGGEGLEACTASRHDRRSQNAAFEGFSVHKLASLCVSQPRLIARRAYSRKNWIETLFFTHI